MRSGLTFLAMAGLLGTGCLSPDTQPARPVAQAEVEAIEREGDEPRLIKKPIAELHGKFRPNKDAWDRKGVHEVGDEGLEIDLGKVEHATRLEVVFSNAYFFNLTFFKGDEQVGTTVVGPRVGVKRKKLVARRPAVPQSAITKGYDRILIEPREEERKSVASVRLLPADEAAKWDARETRGNKAKRSKDPTPVAPAPNTAVKPAAAPADAKTPARPSAPPKPTNAPQPAG